MSFQILCVITPSAKFLYVIRNPIQMLESWIAGYINKINKTTDSFQNKYGLI